MRKLQRENGLTYFFISHNMAVISHISDRVGVMYLGRLVEQGSVEEIFTHPAHPYTRMLMAAIPQFDAPSSAREPIRGEAPSPLPPAHSLSDNHQLECHFPIEVMAGSASIPLAKVS